MRILLIEDDADLAEAVTLLLQEDEHQVAHAWTGEQALVMASEFLPELVISDFLLRGEMNGLDACEQIRSLIPGVEALLISGSPMDQAAVDSLVSKPLAVLEKPLGYASLSRIIKTLSNSIAA